MELSWKTFDSNSRERILNTNESKPIYRVRYSDGEEINVIVENKRFVRNTAGREAVKLEEILEYAVIGNNDSADQ